MSNIGGISHDENEEITDVENNLTFTQSDGESEKDFLSQSVAVT